jgi:hypothetical protein
MTEQLPKNFYAGKPCKRGHVGIRYKSNAVCVECAAIADKAMKEKRRLKYERSYESAKRDEEIMRNYNPVLSQFLRVRAWHG